MPEETGEGITEDQESVGDVEETPAQESGGESGGDLTDPKDSVSSQTRPAEQSGNDKRISTLQSLLDKEKAKVEKLEKDKTALQEKYSVAVSRATELQRELEGLQKNKGTQLAEAADATQAAVARQRELEEENAKLLTRAVRAEFFLVKRPNLRAWAELAPVTSDENALEEWASKLENARSEDLKDVQAQLQGRQVPKAQPQRVRLGESTADQIQEFLDKAEAEGRLQWALDVVTGKRSS